MVFLELADRRLEVAGGEATVGRSHRCDLVIPDPGMSRTHALVSVAGGRVLVQDLDSANGTFINGRRLEGEAEVGEGDVLLLGETRMVVRLHPPATEPPPDSETPPPAAEKHRLADEPSRSEALAVGDVLPVGEILASPSDSWDSTGPVRLRAVANDRPAATALAGATAAAPAPPPATAAEPAPPRPSGEVLPSLDDLDRQLGPAPAPARPAPAPAARPLRAPGAGAAPPLPAAGFWRRAAAVLADTLLFALLALAAAFTAGGPLDATGSLVASATFAGLSLLVPVIGWSRWGTTPGKRLLGLYVRRAGGGTGIGVGRALARWIGYGASAALLGAGFLMAAFASDRRALHDRIAGTYVGRKG